MLAARKPSVMSPVSSTSSMFLPHNTSLGSDLVLPKGTPHFMEPTPSQPSMKMFNMEVDAARAKREKVVNIFVK